MNGPHLRGYCPTVIYKNKGKQTINKPLIGDQYLTVNLSQSCENIARVIVHNDSECLSLNYTETVIDGMEDYHEISNTLRPFIYTEQLKMDVKRMIIDGDFKSNCPYEKLLLWSLDRQDSTKARKHEIFH
jgi:hypothetical protein